MNDNSQIDMPLWLEQHIDPIKAERHSLARITAVHKDRYMVHKLNSDGTATEMYAELAGNLFYSADSPSDLPTTGDWVYCDFYDEDSHGIIHGVLPRKSLIKRKKCR